MKLTLIPQCEPTHLWKVFECLEADHASEHLKADDGNLVLFDEARSNCTLLIRLLVNEAQQRLVTVIEFHSNKASNQCHSGLITVKSAHTLLL